MKKTLCSVLALIFLIPLMIFRSFTLMKLWGWFVVSTFAISPISMSVAFGFSLIYLFLSYDISETKVNRFFLSKINERDDEDPVLKLLEPWASTLFTLIIGYIVHLFV